jgi:aryl-alcohol dehydrogenase-like predicted oxidoreductase
MLIHRPLGNTGLSCSALGIGTVKWGRNAGLKHAPFELPDDHTCLSLLDQALESGVNVLDTAPAYGIAEERLGQLLGSRREHFHLFTKTGEIFRDGVSSWDFSAEHTRRSVEESLRRLRTGRLDGVLLHCPREDLEVIQNSPALETLSALKAEGKIRSVGISVMSLEGGLAAVPLCDVVMVAWNPWFREHQPVIEAAAGAGCGVLLKKVLSSGNLPADAGAGSENPAAFCVRQALQLPGNPVVIAGTIRPAHLQTNILAAAAIGTTGGP